jgi:glycerate kinase
MKTKRFLVAPTSFKGTLSPEEAARAMASGLGDQPHAICALADGGEGTLDVIHMAVGGGLRGVQTTSSGGKRVTARVLQRRQDAVAHFDSAEVVGLELVPKSRRDPFKLTTEGLARVIEDALGMTGVKGIDIGLGGSGTVDGGAGMIDALWSVYGDGWRFPVPVRALCDVEAPLLGPEGARLYMEQKGAGPDQLDALEARLAELAARFPDVDPETPGAGAAGGLGFGLLALGAEIVPGAETVAEVVGLDEKVAGAEVILTGEGQLDVQTLQGKSISALARRAEGRPIAVFCGRSTLSEAERARFGVALVHELETPGADPAAKLEAAVRARMPELLAL